MPARTALATPLPASHSAFERQQRERAIESARQRRLADAAFAWEVLTVLRPEVPEYRERLAESQRFVDDAVADRLPRAAQAARRGDSEAATQQYLAVLALQPQNPQAADALRALERERNARQYLGRPSRITLTRRAVSDGDAIAGVPPSVAIGSPAVAPPRALTRPLIKMPQSTAPPAGANDVEHAALLAGDGELEEAIILLERRLATERRDTSARRLLASLYVRKAETLVSSNRAAALDAVQKSLRIEPTEPRALSLLSQLQPARTPAPASSASRRTDGRADNAKAR